MNDIYSKNTIYNVPVICKRSMLLHVPDTVEENEEPLAFSSKKMRRTKWIRGGNTCQSTRNYANSYSHRDPLEKSNERGKRD